MTDGKLTLWYSMTRWETDLVVEHDRWETDLVVEHDQTGN